MAGRAGARCGAACCRCARGREVAIATRQAQCGDDLASLEQAVLERFRAEQDADRRARVAATKLHTAAIREIIRALRPDGRRALGDGDVRSPSPRQVGEEYRALDPGPHRGPSSQGEEASSSPAP